MPNCGASAGRSTGLLISDGTDSVLRIFVTETEQSRNVKGTKKKKNHAFFQGLCHLCAQSREWTEHLLGRNDIRQEGASFVHLLWHFNLRRWKQPLEHRTQVKGFHFHSKRYPLWRPRRERDGSPALCLYQPTYSVCISRRRSCSSGTLDTSARATTWWRTWNTTRVKLSALRRPIYIFHKHSICRVLFTRQR